MTEKHFVLATAGHVDHGKSALVKTLTGTDPDRLPEEKVRGLTIELGFAHLEVPAPPSTLNRCQSGSDQPSTFSVGIVDVPGHEDFVRNMIAGIGSVDLALLVIAADDGWMPQTEEHLQILTYLGVKRAVIALTKSDLGKIDRTTSQIQECLHDTPFANSQIIPTSVRTGHGIENLKRALASEFATLPPPRDIGKSRLFVDRAFILHGIGTVVTGTLTGGKLRRGQSVVAQPQNVTTRLRSIQSHGRDLELAVPGMRTAINLPDVALGTGPMTIKRGDVISSADLGPASATLDVLLEKSSRLNQKEPASRAVKNGASVYVHHGTARLPAKVVLLEAKALGCGEHAIAQLRLESPILALLGDRFVIRDGSEQHTVAGGLVLDPDGGRRTFRAAAQRRLLTARGRAPDDVDVCVRSELAHCGSAQSKMLLHKSRFSADEIAAALVRLQDQGSVIVRGAIGVDGDKWRDFYQRACTLIDNAHEKHPEQHGLELVELRTALPDQSHDVFEALISDLCANGFVRTGTTIGRTSHRPKLPPQIQPAAAAILTTLSAKPFDPPARKEIAKDRCLQQALRFLIEQGEAVEVGPDVVLSREAFAGMKEAVTAFISEHGPATVSELRQALHTSRRIIVPLLERFDREHLTRRIRDQRTLADLR